MASGSAAHLEGRSDISESTQSNAGAVVDLARSLWNEIANSQTSGMNEPGQPETLEFSPDKMFQSVNDVLTTTGRSALDAEARTEMQEILTQDDEQGTPDRLMELERLRLDYRFGSQPLADLDRELANAVTNSIKQWQVEDAMGLESLPERQRLMEKIQEVNNLLTPQRQAAVQEAISSFFNPDPNSFAAQWAQTY